jgi:hypothetical protein
MKNLYILPTDQQSRLVKIKDTFFLTSTNNIPGGTFYNIYITSNEEIGEGDWYLDTTVNVIFKNDKLFLNGTGYKKIILTTDPTLIADRVQSIDDEFLLWFVKMSYCEFVVIDWSPLSKNLYGWKIIIPQEEPKRMETPNKTEVIENEIITLLNKAEIDLNRSEFGSLAESIIDYIDEIARRKNMLIPKMLI